MRIIRRTQLPNVAVTTVHQPNRARPFMSFVITHTARFVQHLDDFRTEAEALEAHATMVVKISNAHRRRQQ